MADNNDSPTAEWTKRGNASATFARVGEARKWQTKVLEEMRQNRRNQAGHIEIAGIHSLPGTTVRNELRIAVHTVDFTD